MNTLAAKLIITTGPGQPLVLEDPIKNPAITSLSSLVSAALPYLFAISGVILFIFLIWGGFDYLTSMGDPKQAEAGKNKITNALIGFILIFVAFWIVQIIDRVFNLGVYS
jgi:hypothetical protein